MVLLDLFQTYEAVKYRRAINRLSLKELYQTESRVRVSELDYITRVPQCS